MVAAMASPNTSKQILRPSCPRCCGPHLRGVGRRSGELRLELDDYNRVVYRTSRGKLLPETFVLNVRCETCPLLLTVRSFRLVWGNADRPKHLSSSQEHL